MKSPQVVGVCMLLVLPSVLLAWRAAAGQTETTRGTIQTGATTATSRTTRGVASELGPTSGQRNQPAPPRSATGPDGSVLVNLGAEDPLKDVAELSEATADQLQAGDMYLEWQTQRLAMEYAETEDEQWRADKKDELTKVIQRHFDVKHEIRKREIDDLETRVQTLREHLQKRHDARQAIVDMRLSQFINTADGLGWDAEPSGSYRAYGATSATTVDYGGRNPRGTTTGRRVPATDPVIVPTGRP